MLDGKMLILVACEMSGRVKQAFQKKGHRVISCDLKEGAGVRTHYQGNVKDILQFPYDLIIAHPPCTYLCNSGVRWLKDNPERWNQMLNARDFFMLFYNHPCKKICIENPIPHKYTGLPEYTQIIQPFEHGHTEMKSTCLWLKGLPELLPRRLMKKHNQSLWRLSPGENRSEQRSKTFYGIARSMAEQWG